MQLNLNELRELLAAINQTDFTELTLKDAEFELTIRRGGRTEYLPVADTVFAGEGSTVTLGMTPPAAVAPPTAAPPAAAAEASPKPAPAPAPQADQKLLDITSPMVGTFYRSPAPDEPPFVDTGDRIRLGQTVCIIEAMKLMNELEAEVAGEIVEILVQNAEPVEYGQVLMRVRPL